MAGERSDQVADNVEPAREIHVADFVQCRALEMEEMMRSVSEPVSGGSRSVMQLLPRHMRRRAANHDVRRLPLKRRLDAQIDTPDSAKAKKRASRRHRRRPRNLLTEYARRKRRHVWLETHIWHAKRFHMTKLWGYKIPNYPNDRGVRAAYRDAISRCAIMLRRQLVQLNELPSTQSVGRSPFLCTGHNIHFPWELGTESFKFDAFWADDDARPQIMKIQDLSYYCCIEVTGKQQYILNSLSRITSPDIGPTFRAASFISGRREGSTVLYRENSFPFHALGEVTFLWRPPSTSSRESESGAKSPRQLWIWTHPASYVDILTELKAVLRLTEADCRSLPICGEEKKGKSSSRKRKMKGRKADGSRPKQRKLNDETQPDLAADKTKDSSPASQHEAVTQTKVSPDATSTRSVEKPHSAMSLGSSATDSRKVKHGESVQRGDRRLLSKTDPVRTVYENCDVRLESLKDELCRFRLVGPKSHQIVVQALRLVDSSSCSSESSTGHEDEGGKSDGKDQWLRGSESRCAESSEQFRSWTTVAAVQNAAELPPFCIHGLTVRDPRLFLPQYRTAVSVPLCGGNPGPRPADVVGCLWCEGRENGEYPMINSAEVLASSSAIWDRAVRDEVQRTMLSTAELNRHRSKCLLPGSMPDLGGRESCVPVLLVQVPGCQKTCSQASGHRQPLGGPGLDFGCGWDVILPSGWSMAFWIALIYRGAKAVGLREQHSLAFEAGDLVFPDSCPDTPSAARMSSSRADELRAAYDRRPPAKRCNYVKMGVAAPFHCPWRQLVRGWIQSSTNTNQCSVDQQTFYCLRSRKSLRLLHDICSGVTSASKSTAPNDVKVTASVTSQAKSAGSAGLEVTVSDVTKSSGLTEESASISQLMSEPALVRVRLVMLSRGAPSQFALISLPTTQDLQSAMTGPTEPVHHPSPDSETDNSSSSDVVSSNSRPTIGFVVEGGFSHASGKGCGVGFVAVQGLLKLLEQKRDRKNCIIVLVRSTHSLHYRLATLFIAV